MIIAHYEDQLLKSILVNNREQVRKVEFCTKILPWQLNYSMYLYTGHAHRSGVCVYHIYGLSPFAMILHVMFCLVYWSNIGSVACNLGQ